MHRQYVYTAAAGFTWAEFHNPQVDTLQPLHAGNADFRDAGDRVTLAGLGVFSIDRAGHRCARRLQALREQEIADAYVYLGLDQRAERRRIAQEVTDLGLVPDGCWARSTGAYAAGVAALDRETVAAARRIRASERYFIEIAGDEVCTAVFALGA